MSGEPGSGEGATASLEKPQSTPDVSPNQTNPIIHESSAPEPELNPWNQRPGETDDAWIERLGRQADEKRTTEQAQRNEQLEEDQRQLKNVRETVKDLTDKPNEGSPETTPQRPDQQEGIGQSNHDRTRISIPEAEVPVSLKGIVEFLQDQKFDPERQFYEFEVTPEVNPIRAEDVRALVQLPYDVSLGELSGKIIIRTGMSGRIGKPRESGNILDRSSSRLSMHTHPPKALGEPDMFVPSFPDLYLADLGEGNAPLVLAHTNGMMVYRAPVVNPLTGESASDEMRELFLSYTEAKGVDIFNLGRGRNISDIPKEEQVRLLREFIDGSQAVVDEAKWEDTEGIERIMKIVNLKK